MRRASCASAFRIADRRALITGSDFGLCPGKSSSGVVALPDSTIASFSSRGVTAGAERYSSRNPVAYGNSGRPGARASNEACDFQFMPYH